MATADAWELLQILEKLELLDDMGQETLVHRAVHQMYSTRCLDQLYEERKGAIRDNMDAYFRRFKPSMLPEAKVIGIPKLKKYCAIPALKLQLTCAEGLIIQGDGAGVETIIDLMSQRHVSWNEGIKILSQNKDCTSEMVRDIVKLDDLEWKDDDYIGLMEKLSREFHPPMARRARAVKDWKRSLELLDSGQIIDCEVANWNPNGLVVSLGMITGQVPLEELDAKRHGLRGRRRAYRSRLSDFVGMTIPAIVIAVDRRKGHLALSEKQAREKLVSQLLRELEEGQVCRAIVTNLVEFGVFVDLDGADGLIHISELSWKKVKHPREVLSVGDRVQVCVLSVDQERRRVSLSRKRLLPDPLLEKLREYQIGQTVSGKVTKVTDYGAFVTVEKEVGGLVHVSELSDDPISHPREVAKRGDELTLRVLRVDEEKRGLVLSLKQVGKDELFWGSMRVRLSQ
jgi:predicted RNA-binding protein with RPS1 domain